MICRIAAIPTIVLASALQPRNSIAVAAVQSQTPTEIVSVSADAIAAAVMPECAPDDELPHLGHVGVTRAYLCKGGVERLLISVGIYANELQAAKALHRTAPQMGKWTDQSVGDEYFFSSQACHARLKNMVVMVGMERRLTASEGTAIGAALESALRDPAIVSAGTSVNTPDIEVVDVSRVQLSDREEKERDVGFNIIIRYDKEDELLFPDSQGVLRGRKLERGHYELAGGRDPFYGDMTIRAARPTGEVVVLDVEEIVKSATKVGPSWVERERADEEARLHRERHGLSDAERKDLIENLRRGVGNDFEQGQLVKRLADERAKESVPILVEILQSDRAATVKAAALDGLQWIEGRDGLEHFRTVAIDRSQPESIRSRAVKLIGEFGLQQDKSLLQRIAREEGLVVPSPHATGAVITTLRQNRFDGRDLLLFELWEAGRRLEVKAQDD